MPFFKQLHEDTSSNARTGLISTDHGDILTPAFMPVGTQATVKTLDSADIKNIKSQIILGNTYHLHLQPGEDVIADAGGLHKFMNWPGPILTDSGGFQVFSLGLQKEKKRILSPAQRVNYLSPALSSVEAERDVEPSPPQRRGQGEDSHGSLVKITEDGVTFRSHRDGSSHYFTPEVATEIQHKLGADIIMAFDECTPDDADYKYAKEAMDRTHRWAKRSLDEHNKNTSAGGYRQYMFGIIQGAIHRDLREESARQIAALDFDGIAIGGESIGYNMEKTGDIIDWVRPLLPIDKPRYAMGIGLHPIDLLIAVEHGIDMFDCVAPTRLARHGLLLAREKVKGKREKANFRINIKNSPFKTDKNPIDRTCDCSTCQNYSRSYIHHLFAADEMLAMPLASIHNLRFMLRLMEDTRAAINEDKFSELKKKWL